MTKDYSYLEGREFFYSTGSLLIQAKVLYADYYVGLTCVALDNPSRYLICLRGPSSPKPHDIPKKVYQALWASFTKQIEHGYVEHTTSNKIFQKHLNSGHIGNTDHLASENCAFGQ